MAGRPEYIPSEAHLQAAYDGAMKGLSHAEIAESLGISVKTLRRNKVQFLPVIKTGRIAGQAANIKLVENALLKSACGYEYTEQSITTRAIRNPKLKGTPITDGELMWEEVDRKVTKKFYPASAALAIFYLCNRDPEKWKNVAHIITSRGPDTPKYIDLSKFDSKEIDLIEKMVDNFVDVTEAD